MPTRILALLPGLFVLLFAGVALYCDLIRPIASVLASVSRSEGGSPDATSCSTDGVCPPAH